MQHGNLGKRGKDKCAVCAGAQRGHAATSILESRNENKIMQVPLALALLNFRNIALNVTAFSSV